MSLQAKSLFLVFELSKANWRLRFGDGSRERERTLTSGAEAELMEEIARAKVKLGLPADAPVIAGYEAGRDGHWIARMLQKHGVQVYVMDPASIEVSRQARRRKTDRLDAKKLLQVLLRKLLWGDRKAFAQVQVPSEEQETDLRWHRERERLVKERTGHRTRLHSLCALHGVVVKNPARMKVAELRDWQGQALRAAWQEELQREQERLQLVEAQLAAIEKQQVAALAEPGTPALQKAQRLWQLRAVGLQSAWLLGHECFGWRQFRNRKQVGSFAGLTGTPFDSGETRREQGISKAGNRRVRVTMVELAWSWVRYQPHSALTLWFVEHYARSGTSRCRRKGIVALARKLLVALWKYVEQGVIPAGAMLRSAG